MAGTHLILIGTDSHRLDAPGAPNLLRTYPLCLAITGRRVFPLPGPRGADFVRVNRSQAPALRSSSYQIPANLSSCSNTAASRHPACQPSTRPVNRRFRNCGNTAARFYFGPLRPAPRDDIRLFSLANTPNRVGPSCPTPKMCMVHGAAAKMPNKPPVRRNGVSQYSQWAPFFLILL